MANAEADLAVLPCANRLVTCKFSPDNRHLVACNISDDASVTVCVSPPKQRLSRQRFQAKLSRLISARTAAFWHSDRTMKTSIYEIKSGKLIARHHITQIGEPIRRVAFSHDGRQIAVGRPRAARSRFSMPNLGRLHSASTWATTSNSFRWTGGQRTMACSRWMEEHHDLGCSTAESGTRSGPGTRISHRSLAVPCQRRCFRNPILGWDGETLGCRHRISIAATQ